jgi:hypothetical protein
LSGTLMGAVAGVSVPCVDSAMAQLFHAGHLFPALQCVPAAGRRE